MKFRIPFLMFILSMLLITSSCVSNKKFAELQAQNEELSASIKDLQGKVGMLEKDKNQLSSEKDELSKKLASVEGKLNDSEQKFGQLNSQIEEKQQQINMLRDEIQAAFSDVEKAVTHSDHRIAEIENMLYLDLDDPINFLTGSAMLNTDDLATLSNLADMLKANPEMNLIIEGHTDDRPIHNARYSDNWDLSVDRALTIVRKLIDLGVKPVQLTAAGKSEFHPKVTDDPKSKETLASNRRTEVIIVPKIGRLYNLHKNRGT